MNSLEAYYLNHKGDIMKVSEHFSLDEIKCHCGCGQAIVDKRLYEIAENFREFVKNETGIEHGMITHCVNRCVNHNRKFLSQGASPKSLHIKGRAMDFHLAGLPMWKQHQLAKKARKAGILPGGVGFYSWGIHIDSARSRTWGTFLNKKYKDAE